MSHPIHQNRRALSATEMVTQLTKLNGEQPLGWRLIDGALEKTFTFKNFYETMGFVNAVAFIANAEDHHPDLSVRYSQCTVRFNTHDVNGISVSDFFCASKVDALLV
ncbi:MAG: 4a-hydroxytetrahydrobiopterin dehydratase [Polaromonas sp.]|jgi:4a-hydroxytetrahydrobiopterin dehydratase|uniref:4a-hydroxytetrahydrobiopterin dehydratase n=1 Tax=Polaromonas sp. TaxID=1869339 RepID=UPI0027308317|nr:4a-hydroxytetrahydrobiopterin dehydratase [Polaromonas sp.]MDP2255407.1 4a-hydroxytetrahydrobiopterin dehydratase [Polaromonas sp.]MDP3708428.1 4a-hydroxytetrahydrobiopterin dehydratase [Polaromonas sp.]